MASLIKLTDTGLLGWSLTSKEFYLFAHLWTAQILIKPWILLLSDFALPSVTRLAQLLAPVWRTTSNNRCLRETWSDADYFHLNETCCVFFQSWMNRSCCESHLKQQQQKNSSDTGMPQTSPGKAWVNWKCFQNVRPPLSPSYTILEVQKACKILWNVNHTHEMSSFV